MTETPAQRRYRRDAVVLAEIGRCLRPQLGPVTVRLPADLAAQAKHAWEREEEDEPSGGETAEQAVVRSFAATLALVGTAVGRGEDAGDDVVVTLPAEYVAGCLFAAEYDEEQRRGEGRPPRG